MNGISEQTEIMDERPKVKRAPSKYNIFMGKCMRDGKNMKECAKEYRSEKREQ